MNPFGLLLSLYIVNILVKKCSFEEKFIEFLTLTIFLELFIEVGYIFKVGSYEVLYSQFTTVFTGIFAVYIVMTRKIRVKHIIWSGALLFSLIMGMIMQIIFPYSENIIIYGMEWERFFLGGMSPPSITGASWMLLVRFIAMVIIAIAAVTVLNKENLSKIIDKLYKCGMIVIGIIFFEWILKNIFKTNVISDLIKWIFGEGQGTIDFFIQRAGFFTIQGFMKEPSHLGASLFNFGLVMILSHFNKNKKKKALIVICLILFISGSFRGAFNALSLICIFIFMNYNVVGFIIVMIIATIIVIPILLSMDYFKYYVGRFMKVFNTIFSKQQYNLSSSELRVVTLIESYKLFLKRPLFGMGLGTTYAFGFMPTILATTGFVTFITWFKFMFKTIGEYTKKKRNLVVVIVLIITWNLQGQMEPAYSLITLLFCLELRFFSNNKCANEV